MGQPDLNLLRALDALLETGSVAGAARKLGLSASAMSRTLARLRETTGDPLLVRAGQGMVLTPHAAALRERVSHVATEVEALLRRTDAPLDLARLQRVFTIRANEAWVVAFAARLMQAVTAAAPGVQLRFPPKTSKDVRPLREGLVDLEIGIYGGSGPELMIQTLYHDHFVGVVRTGHPLATGEVTARRYAAFDHVIASRRSTDSGPADGALAASGLSPRTAVTVPSFPAALAVASVSDLVALVPHSFAEAEAARGAAGAGPQFHSFPLPVETERFAISQIWHPRVDADPAHRWLRSVVRSFYHAQPEPRPAPRDTA